MKQALAFLLMIAAVIQVTTPAYASRSEQMQNYIDHENHEIAAKQDEIKVFQNALEKASLDKTQSQKLGEKLLVVSLPTWLLSGASLGGLVMAERSGINIKGATSLQRAALMISVAAGAGLTVMEGSQIKVWMDEKKIKDLKTELTQAQTELDARKATVEFLEKNT